jgi:serine/threonine-protein kinase RsbW
VAENPITAPANTAPTNTVPTNTVPTNTVPEVRLSVPAHGAFLSLIRTTSAAVAARLEMTIDEIEDLRIAVDEAAAMLLPSVADDRSVDVVFTLGADELTISLSAHTGDALAPDQDGFGWTVLSALAGSVSADHADGRTTIVLSHRRRALT